MNMKRLLVVIAIAGGIIGTAYYYRPKQTTAAGQTVKRGSEKLYRVTRTAVEAGMDEYQKPDAGK